MTPTLSDRITTLSRLAATYEAKAVAANAQGRTDQALHFLRQAQIARHNAKKLAAHRSFT